jgi:hypothetical protein
MKRTWVVAGTGLLLMLGGGSVRPGEKDEARATVELSIQAMGGAEKLEKFKASTWKEKGTYYGMGDGLPYEGTYAVQWPDQFRMEIHGVFTLVLNGKKGWIKSEKGTREMKKEELAQQLSDHRAGWIASLMPLKDSAFKLTDLGIVKVGKHSANVIKVTRADYPDVKLFFDTKSHLLIKSEFRTRAAEQEFKEVTMEVTYSNHRDVNGAKMPGKLVMKRDGKLFVAAENSDMRGVGKLDAKVFAKP